MDRNVILMDHKLMSFDVSSVSTGWSYFLDGELSTFGKLEPNKDFDLQTKLYWFGLQLMCLFNICRPDTILVEETYLKNVKTLKTLMQFVGVLHFVAYDYTQPESVNVNTVRSYFGIKSKQEAFDFVKNRYKRKLRLFEFENDNDVTDSILQVLYWIEKEN